ncbi:hypothetical protein CHS0354_035119 [Potamilus streckersoni]|uniref:Uncharacterized protein n=1 Tax=Potamilus streckersoni TaxID=2493646 RepID=A0AAE0WBK6_9BIVA|nr:hypothetical protein CHS0354_035119 [Potamilus streckersoni]
MKEKKHSNISVRYISIHGFSGPVSTWNSSRHSTFVCDNFEENSYYESTLLSSVVDGIHSESHLNKIDVHVYFFCVDIYQEMKINLHSNLSQFQSSLTALYLFEILS